MKLCPVCQIEMQATAVDTASVDECPQCKGLWFEDQELRLAKDHHDKDLVWMDFTFWKHPERFKTESRHLKCPSGHGELVAVQYGSTEVSVDLCQTCRGVWLDKGEFQRIIDSLISEVTHKSAADYVKSSLEEARELFSGKEGFVSEWRDLKAVLRLLQHRFYIEHPDLMATIMRLPR